MENNCKVYCLKEPESDVVRYVGITSQSLERRFTRHISDLRKTYRASWIKSLKGKGLIPEIELIEDGLSFEDAKKKEIEYIKLFKACGARLVNMTNGGDGTLGYHPIHSVESNKRRSLKLKGRKISEEQKRKTSERCKGKPNFKLIGRKRPEYVKIAISKTLKGRKNTWLIGIPRTELVKNKLSQLCKDKKPVLQYDLQGNFIREWDSLHAVSRIFNTSSANISCACRGITKQYSGFIWKFKPKI